MVIKIGNDSDDKKIENSLFFKKLRKKAINYLMSNTKITFI